jgi:hypothetical protein
MTGEAICNAHLASGSTTVCRAWTVLRRDGVVLGFTDHDRTSSWTGSPAARIPA